MPIDRYVVELNDTFGDHQRIVEWQRRRPRSSAPATKWSPSRDYAGAQADLPSHFRETLK